MSDAALREVERELSTQPASLDLRRQHAHLLLRTGREEEALAALDLAWRLGADELWDELRARLAARRLDVAGLSLCYVPAGPFVMGSDDYDADVAPPHLVELSAFYVSAQALTYRSLDGWAHFSEWMRGSEYALSRPVTTDYAQALDAIDFLNRSAPPPGRSGRYALPTEAQWERVFRACSLRPEGACPYGAERAPRHELEWTADHYHTAYYGEAPRRDPPGPAEGELRVVRGVPAVPDPHWALFREAADPAGRFPVKSMWGERWTGYEQGITFRAVFLPA